MGSGFDQRHLRPVLEFALAAARAARPAVVPAGLKPYLNVKRVPTAQLGALGRVVAGDARFFGALAQAAAQPEVAELVGEIGVVWLTRPDGWEAQLTELVSAAEAADAEAGLLDRLDKADKQRELAERARLRAVAELATVRAQLETARGEARHHERQLAALSATHAALQDELQAARKEARAAAQRAEAARLRVDELRTELDAAGAVTPAPGVTPVHRQALTDLAKASAELADRLADLERQLVEPALPASARRPERRVPLVRPGGVRAGTAEEAMHLLRAGGAVLIDGYNVAKLAWPSTELPDQRRRLLTLAEHAALRFGADVTVVFDAYEGEVCGATADRRRAVRVVFSPPGVLADDVIRSETDRVPASRPVVVVTEDQAVLADVRAKGANTIASRVFVTVAS